MCTKIGDGRHHSDHSSEFVASRSAFFSDLEVFARTQHSNSYPVHLHDRWQLTWILSGMVELRYNQGSRILRAGDALLAAPFEPIGGRAYEGSPFGFVTLQMPAALLREWPRDRIVARRDGAALCERLMVKLLGATRGDEQVHAVNEMAARFLASKSGAVEIAGERMRKHPAIRHACALLDGAIDNKLPLLELAEAIRMNHRYVISLFKTSMGIPPHQYVMARRIEAARRLLNQGHALNTAAAEAGFNDQSHMTRDFKRTFGVTPGAYQAQQVHMNFVQKFPLAVA